jgi:hypothetical protein
MDFAIIDSDIVSGILVSDITYTGTIDSDIIVFDITLYLTSIDL